MSEIKPALTNHEWTWGIDRPKFRAQVGGKDFADMHCDPHGFIVGEDRHALAALALRDQPFGFDWDDVDALRSIAESPDLRGWETGAADSLADRIAALLPPR